jgi:hypothetical protein
MLMFQSVKGTLHYLRLLWHSTSNSWENFYYLFKLTVNTMMFRWFYSLTRDHQWPHLQFCCTQGATNDHTYSSVVHKGPPMTTLTVLLYTRDHQWPHLQFCCTQGTTNDHTCSSVVHKGPPMTTLTVLLYTRDHQWPHLQFCCTQGTTNDYTYSSVVHKGPPMTTLTVLLYTQYSL